MTYGKRTCVICGKEFEAEYVAQISCSDTCKIARKKQIDLNRKIAMRDKLATLQIITQDQQRQIEDYQKKFAELMDQKKEALIERDTPPENKDNSGYEKNITALANELSDTKRELAALKLEYEKLLALNKKEKKDAPGSGPKPEKSDVKTKCAAPEISEDDYKKADAIAQDKSLMKHCDRLNLDAMRLPCGRRPECWNGKPCEKTGGMIKPVDFNPPRDNEDW